MNLRISIMTVNRIAISTSIPNCTQNNMKYPNLRISPVPENGSMPEIENCCDAILRVMYAAYVAGVVAEPCQNYKITVPSLPYRTSHLIALFSSHIVGNPQFTPETCLMFSNVSIMGSIPSNFFMHNLLSPVS